MKQKTKVAKVSGVLEAVHETARGLHGIGLIDKRKMNKYDFFCLKKAPKFE